MAAVRLDPFQNIVGVGWAGGNIGLLTWDAMFSDSLIGGNVWSEIPALGIPLLSSEVYPPDATPIFPEGSPPFTFDYKVYAPHIYNYALLFSDHPDQETATVQVVGSAGSGVSPAGSATFTWEYRVYSGGVYGEGGSGVGIFVTGGTLLTFASGGGTIAAPPGDANFESIGSFVVDRNGIVQ